MEERGECSASSKPSDEIWAKLVPLDSKYSDIEIRSDEKVICSEISVTSDDKLSWCEVVRNSDLCSATLENKSSNTILVDGAKVCNDGTIVIKDGSEIIPSPDREGHSLFNIYVSITIRFPVYVYRVENFKIVLYIYDSVITLNECLHRKLVISQLNSVFVSMELGFVSYRFQIMSTPETCQRQLKICADVEHAKCSICLNIWYDVVTVAPCLHNFCNGCFSEWLRRSIEKRSTVLCPQCRAVVQFVGKNHFLRTIAEDMVRADSSLRRPQDEVALLDTYASVRSNLVIGTGKKNRKRAHTPLDDHSDGPDHQCPQCAAEVGGFRCNPNTVHLQCQACGGMMPSRSGLSIPQYCSGCDRPFCGAYWHALGVSGSGSHPVCSQDTLRPISEHSISRIPIIVHENNLHEQNITESCIRQMGRTLQNVISEWIVKLNNKEIETTRMMLNHKEMITAGIPVCRDCYQKVVSFLLYCFRISIPKYLLPPDASARENCWYGYACRTQHRSEEHARKRNHVCRPTRGSHA